MTFLEHVPLGSWAKVERPRHVVEHFSLSDEARWLVWNLCSVISILLYHKHRKDDIGVEVGCLLESQLGSLVHFSRGQGYSGREGKTLWGDQVSDTGIEWGSSSCHNKHHRPRGLNHRNYFLTVLWRLEIQYQGIGRVCFSCNHSWLVDNHLLPVFSHGLMHLCILIASAYKDSSPVGYWIRAHPNLITSLKTVSPNTITFWGPGD